MDTKFGANRFGAFYAKTDGERIFEILDFQGDKAPNGMNQALLDITHNQSRVGYAYVRKSYLAAKGPSNPHLRSKEPFVKVSLETALDLAADALKKNFELYGASSIYGECYNWGGSGKIGWGRMCVHRMLNLLGGYVDESGDYSTGAGLVLMPYVLGSKAVYDTPVRARAVAKNAKNVVLWAINPLVTSQTASRIPTQDHIPSFSEIKDSGAKIYSVDAMVSKSAKFLNATNLLIRPNTDTAMILSMCYHLYTNDLYDKNFISNYTYGFEKFRDYFLGVSDNTPKTPQWASEICGIDAERIVWFSESLAKEPTFIMVGRALQRADHGEMAYWAVVALSCMLGGIGKQGLGFEFSLGYGSEGASRKIAPTVKFLDQAPKGNNCISIPSSRFIDALLYPNSQINHNGKKLTLPHMRVAFNASGSIFTRHQDINRALKAWQNLDSIITLEPYWTAMAKLSDIVLPVAIEVERYDINQTAPTNSYIVANTPIIKPFGDSKSDYWICNEISKRLGLDFSEGRDELGWMREFYEDAQNQAKGLNLKMPCFDEFLQTGYVQFSDDNQADELYTPFTQFRENPEQNRLKTKSGKIELYSDEIAKFSYPSCPPMPTWLEPFEWLGNAKSDELHIISPHSEFRLHSQLNNSKFMRLHEINGKEPAVINPSDATMRGIKHGDIVRVYNERGEILCGACVSDDVPSGVVAICEGAWYSPEIWGEPSLCHHGCVNVLTKDTPSSELSQSNTAHTTLARIEKFSGELREITAFEKPMIE